MILQRDAHIKIWGWAKPREKVRIQFMDKSYYATTSDQGRWEVRLSPAHAGGPYDMKITASNSIYLKNILIGDVWVCSGQSNMVIPMERVRYRYPGDIEHCTNTFIRQFIVPDTYDYYVFRDDVRSGTWTPVTPESILPFSAVGYFFAKTLYEKYHIPIGIIKTCVGGSPIEAWMSSASLKTFPSILKEIDKYRDSAYLNPIKKSNASLKSDWFKKIREQDKGFSPGQVPWFEPAFDDSSWPIMTIPGFWRDDKSGPINGVVWFRKEFDVPVSMTGKLARLWLGRIVDSDSVYLNGTFVGTTGYQYPPRIYEIPSKILKPGKNILVVRIINTSGLGGFIKDKPYKIQVNSDSVVLTGTWKYQVGASSEPLNLLNISNYQPCGLFNGMIAPILDYGIKGVLWYQGESNTSRPLEYQQLFPTLIEDWRRAWKQSAFPFIYVQLPNFMSRKEYPSESNWAELREAQLKTLAVPNTAMAVTIELGEWNDIHPLNKKDVGKRLALAAQKLVYGDRNVTASGPIYQSKKLEGNKIVISFDHADGGLVAKGDPALKSFAIAGSDRKFVWARAMIRGKHVIVWNDQVPNPVFVRYAWADNPGDANLYNQAGLPASPFQTH